MNADCRNVSNDDEREITDTLFGKQTYRRQSNMVAAKRSWIVQLQLNSANARSFPASPVHERRDSRSQSVGAYAVFMACASVADSD